MQNRVTFFEKEKERARKSLSENKRKYQELLDVQQRHENDIAEVKQSLHVESQTRTTKNGRGRQNERKK